MELTPFAKGKGRPAAMRRQPVEKALRAFSTKGNVRKGPPGIARNSRGAFPAAAPQRTPKGARLRGKRDFLRGKAPQKIFGLGGGTGDCPLTGGLDPALQRDGSFRRRESRLTSPPRQRDGSGAGFAPPLPTQSRLRGGPGDKKPSLKSRLFRRSFPSFEEVGQRGRFFCTTSAHTGVTKEPSPCHTGFPGTLDAALSPSIIPPSINDAGRRGRRPVQIDLMVTLFFRSFEEVGQRVTPASG